jgi:hypothetical protein
MEEQVIIGTPGKVRCHPACRKPPQLPHCVRPECTLCLPSHASGHSARLSKPYRQASSKLTPNHDRHLIAEYHKVWTLINMRVMATAKIRIFVLDEARCIP